MAQGYAFWRVLALSYRRWTFGKRCYAGLLLLCEEYNSMRVDEGGKGGSLLGGKHEGGTVVGRGGEEPA